MVLDPNWGVNLFRGAIDARRQRQSEADSEDERVSRGLQRQQIQSAMQRQQQDDAANAAAGQALAASYAAPPVAPPRPTKTPPDALAGGMPPGLKIAPSLGNRPGAREAIEPALQQKAAEMAQENPDYLALASGAGAPPISGDLMGKLAGAPAYRQMAMQRFQSDQDLARSAPIDAYKMRRQAGLDRHSMKHQDDTLSATKANYGATEAASKRTYDRQVSADQRDQARLDEELNGPGLLKMAKSGAASFGSELLKGSIGLARDLIYKAPFERAKIDGRGEDRTERRRAAEAKIKHGESVLKQRDEEVNRKIQAMQLESDARRRQEIGVEVFKMNGQMQRDRDTLNRMREHAAYGDDPGLAGAALGQEGGPQVTTDGWFGDTTRPIAPAPSAPPPPIPQVANPGKVDEGSPNAAAAAAVLLARRRAAKGRKQ